MECLQHSTIVNWPHSTQQSFLFISWEEWRQGLFSLTILAVGKEYIVCTEHRLEFRWRRVNGKQMWKETKRELGTTGENEPQTWYWDFVLLCLGTNLSLTWLFFLKYLSLKIAENRKKIRKWTSNERNN